MNPSPSFSSLCLRGCLVLALLLVCPGTILGAELLPFPAPERSAPYQQQPQQASPPPPGQKIEAFRREIAGLPCPELGTLASQIQEQAAKASSVADREYFNRILMELKQESAARCQQ